MTYTTECVARIEAQRIADRTNTVRYVIRIQGGWHRVVRDAGHADVVATITPHSAG